MDAYQLLQSTLCHLSKVNDTISRQASWLLNFISQANLYPLPLLSCSLFGCFSVCFFLLLLLLILFFWQLFQDLSNNLFGPKISPRWSQGVKNKPPHTALLTSSLLARLGLLRGCFIPCWVQQTCVYQFTVAGRGGLSVCRPALCLSHCETQQQLDFSLTAC